MLSIGAFNALLKTLEEPPSHVIFILATTEVHKLPQTILSRCLRFDFRLVPTAQLAGRIKYIFDDMGVNYTEDACLAIAEAGDGSVRDALSVADMCVSFGEGKVDYNVVLEVLGASNPNTIIDIVESTLNGDVSTALNLIDSLANYGKSMTSLARDLTKMFRNLFVALSVDEPFKTLSLPKELIKRLLMLANHSIDHILQCVDTLSSLEANMRYSSMPRTLIEASIAKCADEKANIDLTGVIVRLKALEAQIASGNITQIASQAVAPVKNKREFVKAACSGYLVKSTRAMKKLSLYSELVELDKGNYKLENGTVYISPANERMEKTLKMPEYKELIKKLLVEEFAGVNDVVICEAKKIVDINDDILTVKNMFDKDIIKLK